MASTNPNSFGFHFGLDEKFKGGRLLTKITEFPFIFYPLQNHSKPRSVEQFLNFRLFPPFNFTTNPEFSTLVQELRIISRQQPHR